MTDRLDNLTLRQKLTEADRLIRELIHHLEHGFVPKAHQLRRTARQGIECLDQIDVTDMTIRNTVETVISSDDFTRQVTEQLMPFLTSINLDVRRILGVE